MISAGERVLLQWIMCQNARRRKVTIGKIKFDWEIVMNETRSAWKDHPSFRDMNSVEIVHRLSQKRANVTMD